MLIHSLLLANLIGVLQQVLTNRGVKFTSFQPKSRSPGDQVVGRKSISLENFRKLGMEVVFYRFNLSLSKLFKIPSSSKDVQQYWAKIWE